MELFDGNPRIVDLNTSNGTYINSRRVQLAQYFGWTFEVIDRMSAADLRDVFAVIGAQMTYNPKANWWMR